MIDLDEIGRIERRREPWGVGRVDSTADTGADERPACPPEKRWGRCPSGEHRPYQPRFLPTLTDERQPKWKRILARQQHSSSARPRR